MLTSDYIDETHFYNRGIKGKFKQNKLVSLLRGWGEDFDLDELGIDLYVVNNILKKHGQNTVTLNNMLHNGTTEDILLAFEIILNTLKKENIIL